MFKSTTWNIHNSEGQYLGQSAAFAAQTAFCRYMFVTGNPVAEADVFFETDGGDAGTINYDSQEFVLTPQN